MKDPFEVLRAKEQELIRIRREVEALRIVAKMLADDDSPSDGKIELRQVVPMP